MIQILFKLSLACLKKNLATYITLKLSEELYEISEFCLVMANGSCPLPPLECLQAQGTFWSVLEQGGKPCHPERRMGKQQMKDGGVEEEGKEGWRGSRSYRQERSLAAVRLTGNTPTYSHRLNVW